MIHDAVQSFAELDIRKTQKIQEDEKFIDKIYRYRKAPPNKGADNFASLA